MNNSHKIDKNIGTCALCDTESATLKESHSIPKFVYQWIKETSITPYLRSSDDVNKRDQDGPKEYLLCGKCEENLSLIEAEFSETVFKKIANYRSQSPEIIITESMRVCVLSIFWRTLLTTLNRDNSRTDEDKVLMHQFLESAKNQINNNLVTTPIFMVPIYGEPPFYDFPESMTYQLDRMVGAPDIRFFDDPHRYFVVFKLPFMFFYIYSEKWPGYKEDLNKFEGNFNLNKINKIPDFLRNYIQWINKQFELLKKNMNNDNIRKIEQDISKNKKITGSHKSLLRSKNSS